MSDIKIPLSIYNNIKEIVESIDVDSYEFLESQIQSVRDFIYIKDLSHKVREAYAKLKYAIDNGTEDKQEEARIEYLKLKQMKEDIEKLT